MKFTGINKRLDDSSKKFVCGAVEGFYGRPWSTEQRKLLFSWLKKMGLNTYMYAPKDDCKHRAFWRELYSVEEAENMTNLIEAATENNVEFIYAISPGLDITFSNSKDVQCLKRKLEQVATFGCTGFALLFDDIDTELSEADRSVFQSFASAQVSVTNEVYEHLGQPHFYFCPTEYCTSRAVPDMAMSEYLNTIGVKLMPGIDILWTGAKVVTKKITVSHLMAISNVLRRPPIIWDNIHANDYDPRRIFLGPYDGRSPEIIPYLRGVLTNPNTEFEGNYIALHTLGQWSKSNCDGLKKDIISDGERLSPVVSDIKLETECEFDTTTEDLPARLDTRYQPKVALMMALKEWMLELDNNRMPPVAVTPVPIPPPNNCIPLAGPLSNPAGIPDVYCSLPGVEETENNPSYMQPTMNPVNSLVSSCSNGIPVTDTEQPCTVADILGEPMDCALSDDTSSVNSDNHEQASLDNLMQVEVVAEDLQNKKGLTASKICDNKTYYEDLSLLVDLFYLPFEHGTQGVKMLQNLRWVKCNAFQVTQAQKKQSEVAEWMENADTFITDVKRVQDMAKRLYEVPNVSLAHTIFPYVWDILGVLETCAAYVAWLRCSNLYKEAFSCGDSEPWVFRGGLQGEFERLLPTRSACDLYYMQPPEVIIRNQYRYRPYSSSDESAVYQICLQTCDDGMDGTEVFPDMPGLIGDRILGAMTSLSPENCFLVEDDVGVCGYAVAALSARQLQERAKLAWIPAMKEKYPLVQKEQPSPADEVISSFHNEQRNIPETVLQKYQSVVRVDFIPSRVVDYSVPKRLLACALNAIKSGGSEGVHVEMNVGDKCMIDHYRRIGFFPITLQPQDPEDVVYLGRII
ncbi:protein O-GlcNAcase-like isoform X2 [Mizuhopecten yessoensis]|uniref:protein O-GlcNAcase-like isoform X2 n=1 Tax=Mizuhopecten yessoensis TaxID=6573 RepID=UPI000B458BB3|nr:protein O-GlcNAcase-like isoform X2 [Mizuhopecten yessoensis]